MPLYEMILAGPSGSATAAERADVSVWDASLSDEGQLTVDVYDAGEEIIVMAPMAGAERNRIEVYLHQDLLTIRGKRHPPEGADAAPILQECFWGAFSRTLVLPVEVQGELAMAQYANGMLTMSIPKRNARAKVPIRIVDE